MILQYGNYPGKKGWETTEPKACGYSRVYFPWGGTAEYRDQWGITPLKTQHLYLLPTTVAYSLKQNDSEPFTCTFFHYDFFPQDIKKIIEIDLTQDVILENIRSSLEECMTKNDYPVMSALIDVFTLYCREHGLINFTTNQLTPILEYIGENITGELSLQTLSQRAGFNEQYFIRLFKKELGVTPHQYIIAYRIKEARKLLMTEESVTRIAYKTGFSDVKSFSRCFRKTTGVSPSIYKSLLNIKP